MAKMTLQVMPTGRARLHDLEDGDVIGQVTDSPWIGTNPQARRVIRLPGGTRLLPDDSVICMHVERREWIGDFQVLDADMVLDEPGHRSWEALWVAVP